ncbi:aspartate/glutamate racemase family protein [Vibrio sp. V39_P1S14PM300]|uniref:aspartate/glutamate racemase family protein n=1 Tax=Vibrio sp. V39_P1S14PM300 TaxID=1938690 RepID=UPI0013723656|nr:aspartate/glutamate racemase family protein [Vibrio sp. V39_P1S14PM300]NAX23727.1 amino acid racemase [Vibrio sp. V39_P1S14PM300]
MKTIGLLGGMSWESTASYYSAINHATKQTLGGLHSAKLILNSVDFAEIEALQHQGEWQKTAEILIDAAQSVERAGADFLLICTNTMHKVADDIQQRITIPLLHIADATAEALKRDGVEKVGLLGTAFTMEQGFYKEHLSERHGIEVIIPNGVQRKLVHEVIYHELCLGQFNPRSKDEFLTIVADLHEQGAQAVILGCTEIALLIQSADSEVPLYDTTAIHAQAAVKAAIS